MEGKGDSRKRRNKNRIAMVPKSVKKKMLKKAESLEEDEFIESNDKQRNKKVLEVMKEYFSGTLYNLIETNFFRDLR